VALASLQHELRLAPTMTYSISQLAIKAAAGMAAFESELIKRLQAADGPLHAAHTAAADEISKAAFLSPKRPKGAKTSTAGGAAQPLPPRVTIKERILTVGVHNGSRLIGELASHTLRRNSAADGQGGLEVWLGMAGTIMLPQVYVDPAFAIFLQLQYRVAIKDGGAHRAGSHSAAEQPGASLVSSRRTPCVGQVRYQTVVVRWAPVLPLVFGAGYSGPAPVDLEMLGGPTSSPDGSLVYTALGGSVTARMMLAAHGSAEASAAAVAATETICRENCTVSPNQTLPVLAALSPDALDRPLATTTAAARPTTAVECEADQNSTIVASTCDTVHGGAEKVVLEPSAGGGGGGATAAYSTIGELEGLLPRQVLALLSNARFPPLIGSGEWPLSVDTLGRPVNPGPGAGYLDMAKETTDFRQGNKVSMQFMAYTHLLEAGVGACARLAPRNVHFTFQFDRFPPYRSPNMSVGLHRGAEQGEMGDGETRILYGDMDTAGFIACFNNATMVGAGIDTVGSFARYLSTRSMDIGVWDSEAQLLLGTSRVDLVQLLRGGRAAVQALIQVPVHRAVTAQEVTKAEFESGRDELRVPLAPPHMANLVIRLAAVGQLAAATDGGGQMSNAVCIRPHRTATDDTHRTKSKAIRMRQRDPALARSIRQVQGTAQEERSKVSRLGAIRMARTGVRTGVCGTLPPPHPPSPSSSSPTAQAGLEFSVAQRRELAGSSRSVATNTLLQTLDAVHQARPSHKEHKISTLLAQAITTNQEICVTFGAPVLVEFEFTNTLRDDGTFNILLDDRELRLLDDAEEWRNFKQRFNSSGGIEEGMFQKDSKEGKYSLFVRAGEKVTVPLLVRCSVLDYSSHTWKTSSDAPSGLPNLVTELSLDAGGGGGNGSGSGAGPQAGPRKTLSMRIVSQSGLTAGQSVGVLNLALNPMPFRVDRVFRFWHKADSRFDRQILCHDESRVENLHSMLASQRRTTTNAGEEAVPASVYSAFCDSASVSCECDSAYIRVRTAVGPSPQVESFHVVFFDDKFASEPAEIWRICIHSVEQVDVSAMLGDTTTTTFNLPASQTERTVQCFSSDPDLLVVREPHGRFQLSATKAVVGKLGYRPNIQGIARHFVNVVDVNTQQLSSAHLVVAHIVPPRTSKQYDITIPYGRDVTKFATYMNTFSEARSYTLTCDRVDHVKLLRPTITVKPGCTEKISFRFRNVRHNFDSYVFINDANDGTLDDCFMIRVFVSRTQHLETSTNP
jgi:hypothetical protein